MTIPDLGFRTVTEQVALVKSGRVRSRDLVEHSLRRIDRWNGRLNAFRVVLAAQARAEAAARDAATVAGEPLGPLHGVPIAVKDENDIAGTTTTFGTGAVSRVATADSEVVRRLRAAGAVIVGKTLMPEFGLWPFTESSTYGITRNPWNPDRSPGGSSGGTAAAVASGMVAAGIGGDGGGSIRLPAAWCGLVGLKPQRGRVSTAPQPDLWGSLGTLGALTRTVTDTAVLYDVLAGSVPSDRYRAVPWPQPLVRTLAVEPPPLRIRVVLRNPGGGPAPDAVIQAALRRVALALGTAGHRVQVAPVPGLRADPAFVLLMASAVAEESALVDHPEKLERRTRRLLSIARPLTRLRPWAERRAALLAAGVDRVFEEVDLLLMPTVPGTAGRAGRLDGLGAVRTAATAFPVASWTAVWNVTGNPAIAVPIGFDTHQLPLSAQFVGPPDSEPLLLQVALQVERALSGITGRLRPEIGG